MIDSIRDILDQLVFREPSSFKLNDGMSAGEAARLSSVIGQDIPQSLKDVLSIANGEQLKCTGMIGGDWLLSSQEIIEDFKFHQEEYAYGVQPDEGVLDQCPFIQRGKRWRPGWIPILGSEDESVYLDTCPSPVGRREQIILVDVPSDLSGVIATDTKDLLRRALSFPSEFILLFWPFIDPNTGDVIEGANHFAPAKSE